MIGEIEHGQKASALAVRQRLMQAKAPTFRDRIVAINRRILDVTERKPAPKRQMLFAPVDDSLRNIPALRWRAILSEVAAKHKMPVSAVISHRRGKNIVAARHELWVRLIDETSLSYPEIGRRTGDFDHSTILHAVQIYKRKHGL